MNLSLWKISNASLMSYQIRIVPKQIQNEPTNSTENEQLESNREILEDKTFATVEELKGGKLPPEEILSLPMFKVFASLFIGSYFFISQECCWK